MLLLLVEKSELKLFQVGRSSVVFFFFSTMVCDLRVFLELGWWVRLLFWSGLLLRVAYTLQSFSIVSL